ncbi:MAG: four helix bundle protein [Bacteroidota bacterium]
MQSSYKKDNLILELTFRFSLKVIEYAELLEEKKKFIIANQLLRCGTSIGANVREAQNAESKKDFIHKFKIAAKEADELEYWLDLCAESKNYPSNEELKSDLIIIIKIINKIISKSKIDIAAIEH